MPLLIGAISAFFEYNDAILVPRTLWVLRQNERRLLHPSRPGDFADMFGGSSGFCATRHFVDQLPEEPLT
jgi:hypothetical protein